MPCWCLYNADKATKHPQWCHSCLHRCLPRIQKVSDIIIFLQSETRLVIIKTFYNWVICSEMSVFLQNLSDSHLIVKWDIYTCRPLIELSLVKVYISWAVPGFWHASFRDFLLWPLLRQQSHLATFKFFIFRSVPSNTLYTVQQG